MHKRAIVRGYGALLAIMLRINALKCLRITLPSLSLSRTFRDSNFGGPMFSVRLVYIESGFSINKYVRTRHTFDESRC